MAGSGKRAAPCPTSVREVECEEDGGEHGDVEGLSIFGLEEGMRQQPLAGAAHWMAKSRKRRKRPRE